MAKEDLITKRPDAGEDLEGKVLPESKLTTAAQRLLAALDSRGSETKKLVLALLTDARAARTER